MSVTETSENDCSLHKNHTFTRGNKKHTLFSHAFCQGSSLQHTI